MGRDWMVVNPLRWGLIPQILLGVAAGAVIGVLWPGVAVELGLLGQLFVGMLKAVAPLLVMVLVMSAIANRHESGDEGKKTVAVITLYLIGTMSAALVALLASELFPQTIALTQAAEGSPPVAVGAVLSDVLFKLIDNPVNALLTGNFLGCLSWAVSSLTLSAPCDIGAMSRVTGGFRCGRRVRSGSPLRGAVARWGLETRRCPDERKSLWDCVGRCALPPRWPG